jgi:hypothetical protein
LALYPVIVVGGQDQGLNLDRLRERLRAMTDAQLAEFGQAAAYLVTPAGSTTAGGSGVPLELPLELLLAIRRQFRELGLKSISKTVAELLRIRVAKKAC